MSEYSNRITENDLDLGPIEERLAAATPGPWRWGNWSTIFGTEEDEEGRTTLEHNPKYSFDSGPIIRKREDDSTCVIKIEDERGAYEEADLELIEHAPTDIAALIAEVKRLREVEETLRDRIDQMEYTCEH